MTGWVGCASRLEGRPVGRLGGRPGGRTERRNVGRRTGADDHLTYDGCGGCAEGELEEPEGVVLEADEEEVL